MITDIEIDLPVRTVYNQWTEFQDFPLFMKHVQEVRQISDDRLHWKARIAGVTREWEAQITEQTPDQRIAWRSVDGTENAGVVTFHALSDDRTRVVLQLDVDPQGFAETVAAKGGMVEDRAEKDLERFKEFIERRGQETGGYRGTIARETADGRPHPNEHGDAEDDLDTIDLHDRDTIDLRDREPEAAERDQPVTRRAQ
jgi:uncharacterized membrane protein